MIGRSQFQSYFSLKFAPCRIGAQICTNHTVPYGTSLWVGAFPGTSCQATINLSLRDKSHSTIEAPPPLVPFRPLEDGYKLVEMKAANKRKQRLSRLLDVALDTALLIVIGYALVLLSQSQVPF